jgi:hypothetical protein
VWVVPSSRDDFFRHAQGDQEPRGTELIAVAQPVRRTDSQADRAFDAYVRCVALNYLASRVWVERTLDNPASGSTSRKTFSWVRFRASLWVRFLCGRVVGHPEVGGVSSKTIRISLGHDSLDVRSPTSKARILSLRGSGTCEQQQLGAVRLI